MKCSTEENNSQSSLQGHGEHGGTGTVGIDGWGGQQDSANIPRRNQQSKRC